MIAPARRITEGTPKSFGMYEKGLKLEAQGIDLYHMEFGRPCEDTPAMIKQAAVEAMAAGHVHYSDLQGEPSFREALAAKLRNQNGIEASASDILVTNGLTHGSFAAIMATIDPGDEVILLEPYYPQHVGKVELAGGTVVTAPLDQENEFRINPDLIRPQITDRTRAIMLINPCNPTGRVYERDELEGLAKLAIEHDLLVISDEVYEEILYEGEHISIATLPGMAERTISLFAFTKAYAMDGWRLGYATAPKPLLQAMLKITANDVTHINPFVQYGGLAALQDGGAAMKGLLALDKEKRDVTVAALADMPGVECATPQATIYIWADISGTGMSSSDLAVRILEEAHVVVEAGSFYGETGKDYLRICFGSEPLPRIQKAVTAMKAVFTNSAAERKQDA
ncbi:pyridoxal phosphate-dependent aminotransferase [Altericroceibacterium endophyticum]|uniref:aspartate transaminase n=1 Tax=Altericroceibacterium endophyticum TaxID=1808508 RepID=A0A6I4T1V9_9SPHN|nr:aminotransferase class I/II-fold pyridoxal phosphate-dependent enzyme [Altericroceibacterium endophyticum]MXO64947.1 aminotransferase class I/II-fold pyridoxal phosphate-dependent enzyme [Altericroceibacterium endophyticum]